MKKGNLIRLVGASCFTICFLLPGCNEKRQIDTERIKTIQVEKQAHLQDDDESPTCRITICYNYLADENEADSVARYINHTMLGKLLSKEYAELSPEEAVDSFMNVYIANYRKDIRDFYLEDLKNGVPKYELPSWYNYEYSLTTEFADGKEGMLNVTSEVTEYTGGAHPNTWGQWMNFDKISGRVVTTEDVFISGSELSVSKLLLDELIMEMADRLEDKSIQSLEDLQREGILTSTDIYVPDNFLLQKDGVAFLYNRYDIAPYAVGDIVLYLPYTEIALFMKPEFEK